jgi:hypothetical protein
MGECVRMEQDGYVDYGMLLFNSGFHWVSFSYSFCFRNCFSLPPTTPGFGPMDFLLYCNGGHEFSLMVKVLYLKDEPSVFLQNNLIVFMISCSCLFPGLFKWVFRNDKNPGRDSYCPVQLVDFQQVFIPLPPPPTRQTRWCDDWGLYFPPKMLTSVKLWRRIEDREEFKAQNVQMPIVELMASDNLWVHALNILAIGYTICMARNQIISNCILWKPSASITATTRSRPRISYRYSPKLYIQA